jgi:hypothetical protein
VVGEERLGAVTVTGETCADERSTSEVSSAAPWPMSKAAVSSSPARTAQRSADRPASESYTSGSAPQARRAATTSEEAFAAAASANSLVALLAVSPVVARMAPSRSETAVASSA